MSLVNGLDVSVLDIVLDLVSKLAIVVVSFLEIEVNQQTQVIVESQQFIFVLPIGLQLHLELINIACPLDVPRPAIVAVPILRHELINVDARLVVLDCL